MMSNITGRGIYNMISLVYKFEFLIDVTYNRPPKRMPDFTRYLFTFFNHPQCASLLIWSTYVHCLIAFAAFLQTKKKKFSSRLEQRTIKLNFDGSLTFCALSCFSSGKRVSEKSRCLTFTTSSDFFSPHEHLCNYIFLIHLTFQHNDNRMRHCFCVLMNSQVA